MVAPSDVMEDLSITRDPECAVGHNTNLQSLDYEAEVRSFLLAKENLGQKRVKQWQEKQLNTYTGS